MESEPVLPSEFYFKSLELLEQLQFEKALEFIDGAIERSYFGADVYHTKAEILGELRRLFPYSSRAKTGHDLIVGGFARAKSRDGSLLA